MDVIFTIVSRNYGAQAASLMESLRAVEPGVRRVVVTTDGPIAFKDPGVRTIDAATLVPDFAAMCAYYDALELNTAVKPHAFKALLAEEGVTSGVYLDPDIWVYRPLDMVREGLARAPLALTPHTTRPLLGQANPNDHVILTSGAYNLGFMAARAEPQITALLDWWAEKLRFDCRVDFANGLFTDQKWMDLAPGFVSDLALLRSPSLNLAYWNLEGREVAKSQDGWSVDGQPLTFFHFSGFDPSRPELLSKHQDRVRVQPGSPLADLMRDYAGALLRNGHAEASAIPYGHRAFPSGRPITHEVRRRMLAAARAGDDFGGGLTPAAEAWSDVRPGEVIRDPIEPPEGAWLASSGDLARWLIADQTAPAVTALLTARRDLRDRFGGDEAGLKAWLLGPESLEGRFSARLAPEDAFADPDLALRAARYVSGEMSEAKLLFAAYGLAHRADWPRNVAAALRSGFDSPVRELARGHPFPRLFLSIWESRGDLQRLFPLGGFSQRFAFLRWLIGGGLAEYGIDVGALPPSVDSHPVFELARLTVRREPGVQLRQPATGAVNTLLVVERWTPDAAGGDALVFDASASRFRTPEGAPAGAPAQVANLVFRTGPGLLPADAVALLSQGVTWRSASA
ncbi:MAG: hypothetical protein V4514_03990 [Pseudomonadota bacterium]|uniref:hypothetical protein n=1 Tax=Phenylobacterium sp. TaxID=1871053 RepID=UPI0025F60BF9|nr:hypothetical protein [Phenylobacterium sp.]MBT9471777.1 hypothetical protein [Phenylobacterium sp.]